VFKRGPKKEVGKEWQAELGEKKSSPAAIEASASDPVKRAQRDDIRERERAPAE